MGHLDERMPRVRGLGEGVGLAICAVGQGAPAAGAGELNFPEIRRAEEGLRAVGRLGGVKLRSVGAQDLQLGLPRSRHVHNPVRGRRLRALVAEIIDEGLNEVPFPGGGIAAHMAEEHRVADNLMRPPVVRVPGVGPVVGHDDAGPGPAQDFDDLTPGVVRASQPPVAQIERDALVNAENFGGGAAFRLAGLGRAARAALAPGQMQEPDAKPRPGQQGHRAPGEQLDVIRVRADGEEIQIERLI